MGTYRTVVNKSTMIRAAEAIHACRRPELSQFTYTGPYKSTRACVSRTYAKHITTDGGYAPGGYSVSEISGGHELDDEPFGQTFLLNKPGVPLVRNKWVHVDNPNDCTVGKDKKVLTKNAGSKNLW